MPACAASPLRPDRGYRGPHCLYIGRDGRAGTRSAGRARRYRHAAVRRSRAGPHPCAAARDAVGQERHHPDRLAATGASLAKENLARDRAAFTRALIEHLRAADRLPDIIHAHFADAADVARQVRDALGVPFIYTAHSLAHDKAQVMESSPALAARLKEEDRAIAAADAIVASSRDECERQPRLSLGPLRPHPPAAPRCRGCRRARRRSAAGARADRVPARSRAPDDPHHRAARAQEEPGPPGRGVPGPAPIVRAGNLVILPACDRA